MKWHLRRIIWLLITCRTCFRHQTPLSTPNKQRIRPHLYTGLQHQVLHPGSLLARGVWAAVAALWWFNSTTALLSDLAHHHYTCPHTLALDLGQNRRREAPPVLPPSAMPVTASLLPSAAPFLHRLDREIFTGPHWKNHMFA